MMNGLEIVMKIGFDPFSKEVFLYPTEYGCISNKLKKSAQLADFFE